MVAEDFCLDGLAESGLCSERSSKGAAKSVAENAMSTTPGEGRQFAVRGCVHCRQRVARAPMHALKGLLGGEYGGRKECAQSALEVETVCCLRWRGSLLRREAE